MFSSEGLGDSIIETIKDRTGKVKIEILGVKGDMEDFRMHSVGGMGLVKCSNSPLTTGLRNLDRVAKQSH